MANFYQFVSATILNGEIRSFGLNGRYIRILTWNSTTALGISFDGSTFGNIFAGMWIKLPETANNFNLVYFQNSTGGDVLLEVGVSDGEVGDGRLSITGTVNAAIPGLATAKGYGLVQVTNAANGTKIIASNTARRSLLVRNLVGNANIMYIGFTNAVSATNYIIALAPGEVYTNGDYTGDLYAIAGTNANEKISYGEV